MTGAAAVPMGARACVEKIAIGRPVSCRRTSRSSRVRRSQRGSSPAEVNECVPALLVPQGYAIRAPGACRRLPLRTALLRQGSPGEEPALIRLILRELPDDPQSPDQRPQLRGRRPKMRTDEIDILDAPEGSVPHPDGILLDDLRKIVCSPVMFLHARRFEIGARRIPDGPNVTIGTKK